MAGMRDLLVHTCLLLVCVSLSHSRQARFNSAANQQYAAVRHRSSFPVNNAADSSNAAATARLTANRFDGGKRFVNHPNYVDFVAGHEHQGGDGENTIVAGFRRRSDPSYWDFVVGEMKRGQFAGAPLSSRGEPLHMGGGTGENKARRSLVFGEQGSNVWRRNTRSAPDASIRARRRRASDTLSGKPTPCSTTCIDEDVDPKNRQTSRQFPTDERKLGEDEKTVTSTQIFPKHDAIKSIASSTRHLVAEHAGHQQLSKPLSPSLQEPTPLDRHVRAQDQSSNNNGENHSFDSFFLGDKRNGKPSYDDFLLGAKRNGNPAYDEFLLGAKRNGNPAYDEFLLGAKRNGNPAYDDFLLGAKRYGNPAYEDFLLGAKRNGNPAYDEFVLGAKRNGNHAYEDFILGAKRNGNHAYDDFLLGAKRNGNPAYEDFLLGAKRNGNPAYDEFVLGAKRNGNPAYDEFGLGAKRNGNPAYDEFVLGEKRNGKPSYDEFLLGKKRDAPEVNAHDKAV